MNKIKTVRFSYNGKTRIVDNVTEEPEYGLLTGFEMREDGRFSYKIKRYSIAKIEGEIVEIDPPERKGPVMGRP